MESILKLLRAIFPDFKTARNKRTLIRYQCKENLNALERKDELKIITSDDFQVEHLHNWTEDTCVQINHLIKKHGSMSRPSYYKISTSTDTSDLESQLKKASIQIRIKNGLNWLLTGVFVVFVVGVMGVAVFLGIVGVDAIVDGLQRFV